MSKLDYQIKYLQDHRKTCSDMGVNWYVIEAIDEAIEILQAKTENRILILPTTIGSPVYIAGTYDDADGTIVKFVEESHLSGYIKEGDREFYTLYDESGGSCDVEPENLYTTREEAEEALKKLG